MKNKIKELIKKGETETLEFKKSTSELKEAVISIAAILNKHRKGELYFGVENDGKVIGQMIGKQTIRSISQTISNNIEPKIFPKIKKIIIEEKNCIYIEFSGAELPYYAYGRAYIRVGDEDRRLSAKELENMILKKNKEKLKWDTEVCEEAKLSDISTKRLKWFLKEAGREYNSVENSLDKIGLIKGKDLLNVAVILFGKKPQKFFQNAKLRCAVFATNDTHTIIDRQEFQGNLFYLIEKAEEYILKNIHIGMRLEGLRRIDIPEIDKDAFREAIINAFCHRDYYQYDSVNIAIFKNRIEIRSPGGLYGGLTIKQIKKERVSKRRNEIIASIFHEVHFVERWGRGISLILSKEPDADFKVVAEIFITTFNRKYVAKEKAGEWLVEGLGERLGERLGENQKKILVLLNKNKFISIPELSRELRISTTAIENNIAKLKQKGLLKRIGPAKGGYWGIIKK